MSRVRALVGTRKGAFVLTSDGKRERWDVTGPHFGGWEMYHLKGSPADPDRLYAAQGTSWFGQLIQRSNDGGKTWDPVGNMFFYDGPTVKHLWYDGTPPPWEFARVWHLEPSPTDAETVYAGVEDAALFRTTDGGQTWHELPGLRTHESASTWAPGAGGMCLHTILFDPKHRDRIFVAISSAGTFRSDDAGKTWRPINRGLRSEQIPNPTAEVGHCVHRIAMHRSRPGVLFMQKHWDVMRSVVLPPHLRKVARVDREVQLDVEAKATQRSVLDALEARYPMLRGTIRDQVTQRRRPFVRFFACEQDLSNESPDAALPDAVATGAEPFLIVGAMSGG